MLCLDYCILLLYGLPSTMLKKLQLSQKMLASFMAQNTSHCEPNRAKPLLQSLHWLLFCKSIKYEVASLTFILRLVGRPQQLIYIRC